MSERFPVDIIEKVSLVNSFEEACAKIVRSGEQPGGPVIVSFINSHGFNLLYKDQEFYKAIAASDVLLRDGKGMEILYRKLNIPPGYNLCGTDFIPFYLESNISRTIALFGTDESCVEQARINLTGKGFRIVAFADGFRKFEEYMNIAREFRPEIIVLGMGMPKQEKLSVFLQHELRYRCVIINGGAIIDHFGGKVKRAPLWIRRLGHEWLFRLATEPKRLFKRYVIGNMLFINRVNKIYKQVKSGKLKLYSEK